MINASFIRQAAFGSEGAAGYVPLQQARAIAGVCGEGDDIAAVAWARYGACQLALARPKDAVRSLEAALKLDPDMDEALTGLRLARQALKS